jgi:hypothetical protein
LIFDSGLICVPSAVDGANVTDEVDDKVEDEVGNSTPGVFCAMSQR